MRSSPVLSPASERQVELDVWGAVVRFQRKYLRHFVVLTLCLSAGIWFAFRPSTELKTGVRKQYVSAASLLLPGTRSFLFGRTETRVETDELEQSLSDYNLFARFLENQRVRSKIAERLRVKHPELAPYAQGCTIMPQEQRDMDLDTGGRTEAAADYAQLEVVADAGSPGRRLRRFNRIAISGRAESPKDAQLIASVAVKVLQEQLSEVAVRKVRREKVQIEGYIRAARQKAERLTNRLSKHAELEPETLELEDQELHRLTSDRRRLSLECRHLDQAIRDLALVVAERTDKKDGKETPGKETPPSTEQTLHDLELKVRQMEQVYAPTNETFQLLSERLRRLRAFYAQQRQASAQQRSADVRAQLQAKRALLATTEQRLHDLTQRRPAERLRRRFAAMEHELATWTTELLSWEQQLLRVRLDERLCQERGAAILLQTPLPGTLLPVFEHPFFQAYGKVLKFLPVAPLLSLALLILWEVIRESRRLRHRASYYLDAPVLGELSSLPSGYRRQWVQFKKTR